MASSFASLAASLRDVPTAEKKPAMDPSLSQQAVDIEDMTARIEEMLLRMLDEGASDSVRVAVAKLLFDRLGALDKEDHEARRHEAEERAEAIVEARTLLADFAAAKFASLDRAGEMDSDGTAPAIDAAAETSASTDT